MLQTYLCASRKPPKRILFSLLTQCTTYFLSYLTPKISPLTSLTSFLSKVVRLFVHVFVVKISLNFNKICLGGDVKGRYDHGQRFNGFFLRLPFKVSWHEIFLFQNMLPINACIKVAFFFFKVWSGNLAQIPSFQKKWFLKLGQGYPCCSNYL